MRLCIPLYKILILFMALGLLFFFFFAISALGVLVKKVLDLVLISAGKTHC